MQEFSYVVKDENGIHARPAGQLVKEAQQFTSTLNITCGSRSADLKKLFALMKMGIKQGEEVTVRAEGEDEQKAAETLQAFISANF